jgi:hypothetical protein
MKTRGKKLDTIGALTSTFKIVAKLKKLLELRKWPFKEEQP